jgi:hypothetical protein
MYEEFLSKVSILGQSLLPAASLQPPVSACNQLTSPSPCVADGSPLLSITQVWDMHAHVQVQTHVHDSHRSGATYIHTYHTLTYTHTLAHMHRYMQIHMHKCSMHSYVCTFIVNTHLWHMFMHVHIHICTHSQCTFTQMNTHTLLPVACHTIDVPVCLSLMLSLVSPCQLHDLELKASSLSS